MNSQYVFLDEREEMWAKMLMEALQDNNIPCVSSPVYGVGFALKTGIMERLKVYVPAEHLTGATELLTELFSEDAVEGEE